MARRRDYQAENARREARARAAGFKSAYDQRIRGGARATPDTPIADDRKRAAGHAGKTALLREFQPGSSVAVSTNLRNVLVDDSGRFTIPITVTTPDMEEREYLLRDVDDDYLQYLIDELEDMDADFEEGGYDLRALAAR